MPSHSTPDVHLYFHSPAPVFKARVNMPGPFGYPLTELVFDSVTLGAWTDIQPDMTLTIGTVEGLDDLGRVRVQNIGDSSHVQVGRVSQGFEDGTLNVLDNAFLTVWDEYRVWSKLPYISPAGVAYKDANMSVTSYTTEIPPVAVAGPAFADTIDRDTGLITVILDGSGSYAVADGATIASHTWTIKDGTLVTGTLNDVAITVTFPAGFRWIFLTVTDSNGQGHTTRRPVLAVDPDDDVTVQGCRATQRLTQAGSTLDVEIDADLPRATIPDGCLVLLWWGEPSSPADRSHMKFAGWHQTDNWSSRAAVRGLVRATTLHCVDVAGRLDALPGFPQALERVGTATTWEQMPGLTINKALHYLLHWHSTAAVVADFFLAPDGDDYPAMRLDSAGSSLYDQVNSRALSMVPDHILTCNSQGQLAVLPDWMLVDVANRPAVAATLSEDVYSELAVDYHRPPRVHVLRSSAVVASTDWVIIGGEETLPLAFSIAPGDAFAQGTSEQVEAEGLTLSQADLDINTGHKYARLNARFGLARVRLLDPDAIWDYEPALMQRFQLNISASTAAQRGLPFTTVNFMSKELSVRTMADRTGAWIDAEMALEFETAGLAAQTVIPPESDVPDFETPPPPPTPPSAPFTPPGPDDPGYYYGDIRAYLAWSGSNLYRTWDLQEASPVWEQIGDPITGKIKDVRYVHVDEDTVGIWVFSADAIWWCPDIMAETPTWDDVLTLATVAASDVAPESPAVVEFKAICDYASEPGYLIVATGPDSPETIASGNSYAHAYYWHTHDYGATWTQVDMTESWDAPFAGLFYYYLAGMRSIEIFRSAPGTIFSVRQTPRNGNAGSTAVFKSEDLGHTWTKGFEVPGVTIESTGGAILHPFPSIADTSWLTRSNTSLGSFLRLYLSTDAWATGTEITLPTGYDGFSGRWRVNQHTGDPDHLIAWLHHTASDDFHLMETYDRGANWIYLFDLGLGELDPYTSQYGTPNGWPPRPDEWVLVQDDGFVGTGENIILHTIDNFAAAPVSKTGNILVLDPIWTEGGGNGGIALPKVGQNAAEVPRIVEWPDGASMPYAPYAHTKTVTCTAYSDERLVEDIKYIVIAPPADTKRMVVNYSYTAEKSREDPEVAVGFSDPTIIQGQSAYISATADGSFESPSDPGSSSGSYNIEYEFSLYAGSDWPTNRDTINPSPPATPTSGGTVYTKVSARSLQAAGYWRQTDITMTATVTEIEMDDGTVYML